MHYGHAPGPVTPRPSLTPGKLVAGIALSIMCLPCSSLGVGMMAMPDDPEQFNAGAFFLGFSIVVFGVPGVIMLLLGLKQRRRAQQLQRVAAMGAASVKLPLRDVASELQISEPEARSVVLDAVSAGYLRGRLDLEHGVFMSGAADMSVHQRAIACRHCRATANVVVAPGQVPGCPFCGHPMW